MDKKPIRCVKCHKPLAFTYSGKVSVRLSPENGSDDVIRSEDIAEIEIQCYNRKCEKTKNLIRLE